MEESEKAEELMPPWEKRSYLQGSRKKKSSRDQRHIEAIAMVPYPPFSALKNRMTKAEANLGYKTRFRFVEELGRSLQQILVKKNPDPQECGRENCLPRKYKPGDCMRQNALYRLDCQLCKTEEQKTSVYVGETARTIFDRGLEHMKTHRSRNAESPLVEHENSEHDGQPVEWTMSAICFPIGNMKRQATEGHLISQIGRNSNILNRKGERGQNLSPILEVDDQTEKKGKKRG